MAAQQVLVEGQTAKGGVGLVHKTAVRLEEAEFHRVVDVEDISLLLLHPCSEEHIFIAVLAETLFQRILKEEVSAHQEVGRMESSIGLLAAGSRVMPVLTRLLIAVTQRAAPFGGIGRHHIVTVYHLGIGSRQIGAQEVGLAHPHVAVDEEQPLAARLTGQQIADACTPHILPVDQMAAVCPLQLGFVGGNGVGVARAVLGHTEFPFHSLELHGLPKQVGQQSRTVGIVDRYQHTDAAAL